MIVVHAVNGGQAEVDDETGNKLIESGGWVEAGGETPVKHIPRKRAAKKVE